MDGSSSTPSPARHAVALSAALWLLPVGLAPLALAASPAEVTSAVNAQDAQDQVWRKDRRNGRIRTYQGTVTVNSLTEVKIQIGDRENKYDSSEILEIQWGSVPPAYRDGKKLSQRGQWEEAVASFRTAAGDASGREVVQADARLLAAEALLKWGASEPGQFAECVSECDRFLSDYSDNARVPEARRLKAQALHLSGDAAGAAAGYQGLYDTGAAGDAAGYDRGFCLDAGLDAAWAYLDSGDTQKARDLFTSLGNGYNSLLGELSDAPAADQQRVRDQADVVACGKGFCDLAGDQVSQARLFFDSKVSDRKLGASGRACARLGLAMTLVKEGDLRSAQIEFARVAALDHTSRDRTSRANLGFAEVTLQLGDGDAADEARRRLTLVTQQYGDTPAARQAAALLETL